MHRNSYLSALSRILSFNNLLVLIIATIFLPSPLSSQQHDQPSIDSRAGQSIAHMPHHDLTKIRMPGQAPVMPSAPVTPSFSVPVQPFTAFIGSQYIVGPTITATTTAPEAEEYIA